MQTIPSVDALNQKNNKFNTSHETTWDLRTGQKRGSEQRVQARLQHIPLKKPGSGIPPADMAGPTPGEQVGFNIILSLTPPNENDHLKGRLSTQDIKTIEN